MQAGKKMIADYLRMNMGHRLTDTDVRRLNLLDPVLDFVVRGTRKLLPSNSVEAQDLSVGMNKLIGYRDDMVSVRVLRLADVRRIPSDPSSYAILMVHLAYVEFGAVLKGLGEMRAERLLSFMRIVFASNFNRLLAGQLGEARDHFGSDIMLGVMLEPYVVLSATFAGYMVMGEEAGLVRIAPVLRHMAQVLMVGATADDPMGWIALSA